MKRTACCLLLATLLAACERRGADDTMPADTAAENAPVAAPADSATGNASAGMQAGALFDAQSVKKGDKVGSFEVASNKTQAAPKSRVGVSGSVQFKGEVQLHGSYRAHFNYPDVKEACFWVDVNDWVKLPRVTGDDRIKWFCFTNKDDAIRELGALGTETRATIVISDYTTTVEMTDAYDTAKLERVVKKGS